MRGQFVGLPTSLIGGFKSKLKPRLAVLIRSAYLERNWTKNTMLNIQALKALKILEELTNCV